MAGSLPFKARATKSWTSEIPTVHDEPLASAGAADCRPGAPGGVPGPPDGPPTHGGVSAGARGTPVGAGRSAGPGRLLAGVFSRSGGLKPAGLSFAARLLSA